MIKKILTFSLFFGLFDSVLISCCKDSIYDYTKFNSISVFNTNLKEVSSDSSSVNKSNYRISCIIDGQFIAVKKRHPVFSNSSFATSCDNMGLNGLKSKLVKLEITCNKELLGIPPGQKLNLARIKAYEFGFYDDAKNKRLSIDEWLIIFNNGRRSQAYYSLYFEFEDDIVSAEYLKFRFLMEFQDGTRLEAETANVRIV